MRRLSIVSVFSMTAVMFTPAAHASIWSLLFERAAKTAEESAEAAKAAEAMRAARRAEDESVNHHSGAEKLEHWLDHAHHLSELTKPNPNDPDDDKKRK